MAQITQARNVLLLSQRREFGNFIRSVLCMDPPPSPDQPTPENRFHPWDQSPSPDLRMRAATIKAKAKCPVTHKDINYTCPLSGIPTHHSKEAWQLDEEYHTSKRWEILKKVNIYEHDLRSGRPFPEFDFPGEQPKDMLVNFRNWDTYLYTRQFYSMDTEFQMAIVTKMLTFPVTIASVLHQYSPYFLQPKGPITMEGLKSLAALRYTLYPEIRASTLRERPVRIFLLNARSESLLPPHVWKELVYLFPGVSFELHFVGPECYFDREKKQYLVKDTPIVQRVDDTMCFYFHTQDFNVLHEAQDFFPYDPYLDVFFCFHPRFASEELSETWKKAVPGLLESKCAIFSTAYHKQNIDSDYHWLIDNFGKDLDILMEKTKNSFGSTKWELNDLNPQEVFQFNQRLFGFRGKRYHAIKNGPV
ncbi:translational activator for mitochondrial COX1 [Brettanomyces nanus]|uniref:Translational activator for mitochondrial COX1 n=1 Tax=Eeniella nana TaxID=13502 RepID=A0A875RP04_EENNA|nr:translational activator for mitochondrial COX1 [Brettanomyces nanus]QPG74380.1 translational activator for mitochondrial COX1 [Brettanomyces nanus]